MKRESSEFKSFGGRSEDRLNVGEAIWKEGRPVYKQEVQGFGLRRLGGGERVSE